MAEEIWNRGGGPKSVFLARWPSYDDRYIVQDTVMIAVQVNGKLRSELEVAKDLDDERVLERVLEIDKIKKIVGEKPLRKAIVVKNRIVNLVV
jgi:leucyl-tRNA synthetase